jgi:hypothetical protein
MPEIQSKSFSNENSYNNNSRSVISQHKSKAIPLMKLHNNNNYNSSSDRSNIVMKLKGSKSS